MLKEPFDCPQKPFGDAADYTWSPDSKKMLYVTKKMMPGIKTLYDQMPEPKWVIALGNCAISGGPFAYEGQYSIILGADEFLPVDVYIPGCPPRPEALLEGIIELEHKLSGWQRWKSPKTKTVASLE